MIRFTGLRARTLLLSLAWLSACGGNEESSGGGGNGANAGQGGSAPQAGSKASAPTAGQPMAGAGSGGAQHGGSASLPAGGAGAGGQGLGGASGASSASGAAGTTSAGSAGAASSACGAGCRNLCQGGDCMCWCPTTTLSCWSSYHEQMFQNGCSNDSDCFVGEHYVSCCSVSAVGLNVAEEHSLAAYEGPVCGGAPVCDCATDLLKTDDGQTFDRGAKTPGVHCVENLCASFAP